MFFELGENTDIQSLHDNHLVTENNYITNIIIQPGDWKHGCINLMSFIPGDWKHGHTMLISYNLVTENTDIRRTLLYVYGDM